MGLRKWELRKGTLIWDVEDHWVEKTYLRSFVGSRLAQSSIAPSSYQLLTIFCSNRKPAQLHLRKPLT